MRALAAAFIVAVLATQGAAFAQTAGVTQQCLPESFAALDVACSAQLVDQLREPVTRVAKGTLTKEEKIEEYKRIFAAARVPPACQEAERLLFLAVAACNSSDLALSLDAPASNPASLALAQRGGTIENAALAVRNSNFVSADDSAVTLHLNAAVALCPGRNSTDSGAEPTPCFWDRITGAVTFGAKIPEKEIVGFSGIPDPEKLLDVLVWDANVRLVGDRRPDSARWRSKWNEMAVDGWVRLKGLNTGLFPRDFSDERLAAEGGSLNAALQPGLMTDYKALQDRIGSSLLVTAGFSGQHLTNEAGKNKYTAKLTLDKGFGAAGFTFNASYSSVQDVVVTDGPAVTLKTWRFAAGLSGDFMKGTIVKGRSTEWNLAGLLTLPADSNDVPVDREKVYAASLGLKFPVTETAHVPVVVTFTNDPNSLSKQRYVRGQVGIDYDFKALKNLFKK